MHRPFLALITLAMATSVHAALYFEPFSNTPVGNVSFSTVGWSAYEGTTNQSTTNNVLLVSNVTGADSTPGYGAKTSATSPALVWTTEFGSIPLSQITEINFYSNHANTTDALRIVLRLDNNTPGDLSDDFWVATNTGYTRNSAIAGTAANWSDNKEL